MSFAMRRFRVCVALSGLAACAAAEDDRFAAFNKNPSLVAPTDPNPATKQRGMFKLPPGFVIELIASEPDIGKPMNLAFDVKGRLWVTHSIAYPYPSKDGHPRDAISIIEDTNGDGVPDRPRVFADHLNIPIGVLPLADSDACIAYTIPNIHLFRDTNGDGKADEKKVLYSTFGYVDTHGMASSFNWWIDGWVHGTHGFANSSEVKGADGKAIKMHSGHTYRFKPDGAHIEVFSHGQVNPFGMHLDVWGNVFTADCHTKPAYQVLRGAWYPMFGTVHDGLGMGPEMMDHLHGSTGIAGVIVYSADHFPKEWQGTLFIGNPVTGKINHDRFEKFGTTLRAVERPDFVSCDDPWFRPVAMQLAPDGSLYVADFYNKIIGHYEVPLDHPGRDRERGRIWRISYKGPDGKAPAARAMPDLDTLAANSLIDLLADPNITVRTLATHRLATRWAKADAEPVRKVVAARDSHPWQRVHGLWVLERVGKLDDPVLDQLLGDADSQVRLHAIKVLADRPSWSPARREAVIKALHDPEPFVRRSAADALGRHPDSSAIDPLLALWKSADPKDTHLVHVTRMALRDVLAAQPDLVAVAAQRGFEPNMVNRLADVSLGVPEPKAAALIATALAKKLADPGRRTTFLTHAARYGDNGAIANVITYAESFRGADLGTKKAILMALHEGFALRGAPLPPPVQAWAVEIAGGLLSNGLEPMAREGVDLSRQLRLAAAFAPIESLAGPESKHKNLRPAAMEALLAIDAGKALPSLLRCLADQKEPLPIRAKAAETAGMIQLEASPKALAETLPTAPEQLAVSLARGLSRSDQGGELLIATIEGGKAPVRLLTDGVVAHELRFRVIKDRDARLAKLTKDLPPIDERLAKLVAARREGFLNGKPDVAMGGKVFEKTCGKCHQIAGKGARVGPQLDGVGVRGLDRLLEDVLLPNQNVDQAFRVTTVALDDGRLLSGLKLREDGTNLVMADAEGREVPIPITSIVERRQSMLSPMPADIAVQLPDADFAHLMAYLLDQRTPPPKEANEKPTDAAGK